MKKTIFFLIVIAVILFLGACEKDDDVNPQIDSIAGEIPLLEGDNRIGIIEGFNPSNPDATTDSIEARWNEAINTGMTVGRLQIDWPELEPSPSTYDMMSFEQR
ncbi:MAG: hypothetical protein R6U15_07595 [Candidatus Izemoplasmatales bacterium]